MKQLTPKQAELYEYIKKEVRQIFVIPSYEELKKQFGFRSNASVRMKLKALQKKGYIDENNIPIKEKDGQ